MNTFDNILSSQDIIDLIYYCEKKVSEKMMKSPDISYWEDEMGYPGFSMVWQLKDVFVLIQAFYANDNILVVKSNGLLKHKPNAKNIRKCSIKRIEDVIDKKRCDIFFWWCLIRSEELWGGQLTQSQTGQKSEIRMPPNLKLAETNPKPEI